MGRPAALTRPRRVGVVAAAVVVLVVVAAAGSLGSPPPVQASTAPGLTGAAMGSTAPTTVATPATTAPATGVPLVPIGGQLPTPPVTVPLSTRPANTHVNPWLAKLSIGGFALFLVFFPAQALLTRRRRRRRWTL